MSSKSASTSESLLDELQATLAHGTVARRVETLRRVTDLFINGAVWTIRTIRSVCSMMSFSA
jgi:hypothetical protein